MLQVAAGGQSIRDVLLRLKAEEDAGNAQRIKQAAQRIKKAEDEINRDRTGRAKQSQKYLTDEEASLARYHLARMRREKEYADERSRTARDQQRQADKQRSTEERLAKQAEKDRIRSMREVEREQRRIDAQAARERERRAAVDRRAQMEAEREQLRWGTQLSREYDKRITEQQRSQERASRESVRAQERAAKESARAAAAAERQQLQMGAAMAREYDRDIAARARTRREFAAAADVRHSRTNRLGVAGIGQDAIGVLRGVGHVGVASGLFGEGTENILDALLTVEGGFNIARYGAPLLTNLARRRGVRSALFGGSRMLSGALGGMIGGGVRMGIGGSAGGTALGGTLKLGGAFAAAGIGAGAGITSLIGTGRDIWENGFMGGARPDSVTGAIANAEVNSIDSVLGWLSPGNRWKGTLGWDWLGNKATARTQSRLDARRQFAANREMNRREEYELGQMAGARADDRLLGRLTDFSHFKYDALKAQRAEVAGDAGRVNTGNANSDLERVLRLREMELGVVRQIQQHENEMAAQKLEKFRTINTLQKESLDRSKAQLESNRETIGAMAPGERSRLGSLIRRFQSSKSVQGFAVEDLDLLKEFGGRDVSAMIRRQQRAAGEAFSKEYGVDIGQHQLAGDQDRIAKSRRQIAANSNLFSRPTSPIDFSQPTPSTFNVSINVQNDAELKEQIRKLEQEITRVKDKLHQQAAAQRSAS